MDKFTISELEQFSGIKSHTIRVWERRYNALRPMRSAGNTRYYDNSQLRRLLNLACLVEEDGKISELAGLPDKKLDEIMQSRLTEKQANQAELHLVMQLIAAGTSYDEPYFEKLLSNAILRLGLKQAYTRVLYPLLERIGLMWAANTLPPAAEHFMSNLIRQKLFAAMDILPPVKEDAHSWLLFLPEDEFHEIGLLFSCYVIRQAGHRVYYIGPNTPLETLEGAIKAIRPDHLLMFMVRHNNPEVSAEFLSGVQGLAKGKTICISGNEPLINRMKLKQNVKWLKHLNDLEKELND